MVWILLMMACSGAETSQGRLERGSWTLSGEGFTGELRSGRSGCEVGLWGEAWATGGPEPVPCEVQDEDDGRWLYFPFQSGAGAGLAAAKLNAETLVLPLGARPGEWERTLSRAVGGLDEATRKGLSARAAAGIEVAERGWRQGALTLWDGPQAVGAISLGGPLPEIEVFDALWMTWDVEIPDLTEHGPDLVITFPVMPSFDGGTGQLRVNRVLQEAVVPLAAEPTPDDRRLQVRFGSLSDAERAAAREAASLAAAKKERSVGLRMATELSQAATAAAGEAGSCPSVEALGERWALALPGYRVTLSPERTAREGAAREGTGCVVALEPDPPQHRRRWSARVGPQGVIEERMGVGD